MVLGKKKKEPLVHGVCMQKAGPQRSHCWGPARDRFGVGAIGLKSRIHKGNGKIR